MTPLGRGLASLIPRRGKNDNAEDLLDRIDSEEEDVIISSTETSSTSLNIVDEDEDSFDLEPPTKPLVTLLDIDTLEEGVVASAAAATQIPQGRTLHVVEDEDATSLDVAFDEDDEDVFEVEEETANEPEAEEVEVQGDDEPAMPVEVEEVEESEVVEEEPEEETPVVPEEVVETPQVEVEEADDDDDMDFQDEEEEAQADSEVEAVAAVEEEPVEEKAEVAAIASDDESTGEIWNKHEERIVHIPIGDIKLNPLQPRRSFDQHELDELKDSIQRHGILQPLVVRRLAGESKYELIAGERRLRSAKELKWDKVPCVVRMDVKSDQSRLVYALIENIQRENLNPIEEALAYQQLNKEFGLTHEEIGEKVGKSRVGVTNVMRVLQLPAEIQRGIVEGKITVGHAKAILMIPDEEKQIRFYHHLVDEGVTVRKAETRARRIQRAMNVSDTMERRRKGKHPYAVKYIPPLEDRFGYDANIRYLQEKNQFEVIFRAHTDQDLTELIGRLLGQESLPNDDDILKGAQEEEQE